MRPKLDEDLIEIVKYRRQCAYRLWEPDRVSVVLGKNSRTDSEVFIEQCEVDRVEVLKRLGGGCAVVLGRGMLIISIAKQVRNKYKTLDYFKCINNLIIRGLTSIGVNNLLHKAISDVCIGNKKILGSSLYRTIYNGQGILFYQASLLVSPDISLIERYLKHPAREPEYRIGRKHSDFLTFLEKEGYKLTIKRIINCLEKEFEENLRKIP